MIIVITGVTGSGKTTIGRLLASRLGWTFADADDFHPAANIEKMKHGIALDDEDRSPWLESIRQWIAAAVGSGVNGVLACSALKPSYREALQVNAHVSFVYLQADPALVAQRLANRTGHFMNPSLIASQFATLEEPHWALTIDASLLPDQIVARIRAELAI